jgi:hypothetical protein
MSEVEYERMLDAVRGAVEPVAEEDIMPRLLPNFVTPRAANDNGLAWPLIPFPDGWNAVC